MKPASGGDKLAGKASRVRASTVSNSKHADLILSTIDLLEKRKARSNLSRICHMVQRQHKLTSEQICSELDILVSEKFVTKADFKGSVTYRSAAKWRRVRHGQVASKVTATVADHCDRRNKTGRRVLKAVKNLLRQPGNRSCEVASSEKNSVTLNEIENWIKEKWGADVSDSMNEIKAAATAEVNRGHLVELSDSCYTLRKEEVSMAAAEQTQKRGPGRPRNEDKLRGLTGKSVTVTDSETSANSSGLVADPSAVPVNPARSSSQKKFGGKRKVD